MEQAEEAAKSLHKAFKGFGRQLLSVILYIHKEENNHLQIIQFFSFICFKVLTNLD